MGLKYGICVRITRGHFISELSHTTLDAEGLYFKDCKFKQVELANPSGVENCVFTSLPKKEE